MIEARATKSWALGATSPTLPASFFASRGRRGGDGAAAAALATTWGSRFVGFVGTARHTLTLGSIDLVSQPLNMMYIPR